MPLVAVALAFTTLLHSGSFVYSSFVPSPRIASSVASVADDLIAAPSMPGSAPGAVAPLRAGEPGASSGLTVHWVAPHTDTPMWARTGESAEPLATVRQWTPLQIVGIAREGMVPVWDPSMYLGGWVRALDVGPIDPALVGTEHLPPIGRVAWGGPARVTMYTCVELGGCAATASGLWPELGMVAVDPTVIPLGSTVWIQGLGTFLAADTGSLVRGAHLDVFGHSYAEAIEWGVQERAVLVFAPQ